MSSTSIFDEDYSAIITPDISAREHNLALMQKLRDYVRGVPIELGNDTYFITATLRPKMYKFNASTQYEMTRREYGTKLYDSCKNFITMPELTPDAGNVHYHSIAVFKSHVHKMKFCNGIKNSRILGYCKVTSNPISMKDNMVRTKEYLIKDIETTSKIITHKTMLDEYQDYCFNI